MRSNDHLDRSTRDHITEGILELFERALTAEEGPCVDLPCSQQLEGRPEVSRTVMVGPHHGQLLVMNPVGIKLDGGSRGAAPKDFP